MPIESIRVEDGIYHNHWRASISVGDITDASEYVKRVAKEKGDLKRVAILDLSECSSIPFDITNLLKLAKYDEYMVGYVIVQPSKMAKMITTVLTKLVSTPFVIVDTPQEARTAARELLHSTQNPHPPEKI